MHPGRSRKRRLKQTTEVTSLNSETFSKAREQFFYKFGRCEIRFITENFGEIRLDLRAEELGGE
jgi:hypothetical protein